MDEFAQCEACGAWKTTNRYVYNNRIERHHIVKKSRAGYMRNIPINFKNLCSQCHRLNKDAVHNDKSVDRRYKEELQLKLQQIFHNDYYNIHQIKNALETTKSEAEKLCKTLRIYKEGYSSKELIIHMMGDKNYLEDDEEKENME